ncbi:M28 family peptidase [Flavobacterium sp. xlx-214]|uniref:M28 family metallopeptidase n=1 Tax=unclassified Flavobacterium TaxID=196869 RepID=UPI0013D8149B|nr:MULTISPECIES: M28 family metallopeptidase [unclassified Flavobacterium]MBA5793174.1 M28 family peptidase [Flavobacterium sp. xlx-221]QMI82543.1 M28 family peptidase [Flavobacterium sp. xlx-214]
MKLRKQLYLFSFLLCLGSISASAQKSKDRVKEMIENLSKDELIKHLTIIAGDEMEGRKTGEAGQKMAANYLRNFYKKLEIEALPGTDNYFQKVPSEAMKRMFSPKLNDSENVVAYIKGSEKPDEYIVISAHYDHVGVTNGEIYNGADDNGTGTTALLEMARMLQIAYKNGNKPKRSIVFLHCTGEEYGLHGSRYFVNSKIIPLENIVADLNVDMIGRRDFVYEKNKKDYIYLVGSDKLSTELHDISEAMNKKYTNLTLDYTYNAEKHPEMIYYRSDHYNFAKFNIPVIFYYSGEHADYHKPTDTVDKIDFDQMLKRTQLIFVTAWELANRNERIKLKQ